MKYIFILLLIFAILFLFFKDKFVKQNDNQSIIPTQQLSITNKEDSKITNTQTDFPQQQIIAEGLDTPWAITFLPEGDLLVTERSGRVRLILKAPGFQVSEVVELKEVEEIGEGGLLGIISNPLEELI